MSVWTWLFGTKPEDPPVDDVALLKTGAITGALLLGGYYIKRKIDQHFRNEER